MVTVAAVPFVLGVTGYFALQFDGLRLAQVRLEAQILGLVRQVDELERRIDGGHGGHSELADPIEQHVNLNPMFFCPPGAEWGNCPIKTSVMIKYGPGSGGGKSDAE